MLDFLTLHAPAIIPLVIGAGFGYAYILLIETF